MAFVDNLRRFRLEQFLSQAELARRANMHVTTRSGIRLEAHRLKAGDQAPSTRTVPTLADTLDVEPGELAAPDEVAAARMLGRRCGRG